MSVEFVERLIQGARKVQATEIQLLEGQPPQLRIGGDLKSVQAPPLTGQQILELLAVVMGPGDRDAFEMLNKADFQYQPAEGAAIAATAAHTSAGTSFVLRLSGRPVAASDPADTAGIGTAMKGVNTAVGHFQKAMDGGPATPTPPAAAAGPAAITPGGDSAMDRVSVTWPGFPAFDVDGVLLSAKTNRASDIHFVEFQPPYFRIQGDMVMADCPPVSKEHFDLMLKKMMPPHMHREYESQKSADFGYQIGTEVRFRVVAYYESGARGMVLRLIPLSIPTIESMELPPVIAKISENTRGMVLLTGMTGSGKSTTLAAMIDYMNTRESIRIVTCEDPIEYVYKNKKSVISQREVGKDVTDFNAALRQAMRMDPDVILVGEMRDAETIKVAIKGAETGHLVMSTLHTTSATHTIQRIMGYFPDTEHDLLREQMALNMKASITQRLVKRKDGSGRLAAQEIMVVNATIAKLLKDNRISDIFGVIKGRDDGMQTFDQGLADLVRADKISFEEGSQYCEDFFAYKRFIAGIASTGDKGAILA